MDWLAPAMATAFYVLGMPPMLQLINDVAADDCPNWWRWSIVGAWPIIVTLYLFAAMLDLLGVPIVKRMFRQP